MKQFCIKIDLISQRRENVLFLPSNMSANENALLNTSLMKALLLGRCGYSQLQRQKWCTIPNQLSEGELYVGTCH